MIRPQKKQLYNLFTFTVSACLVIALFILISMGVVTPFLSSIIIIVYAVLVLFFRKQYFHFRYKSRSKFENLQEKINVLKNDIDGKRVILENLPAKSEKISFLFNISQKLIVLVKEEEIFDFFLSIASDLFADSDGILFFTLQNKSDSLSLTRFKKDKGVVIQEKKGGILDAWILRNNQSLIVDDITKDFRFDYRKVIGFSDRKVHSFIASPFSVGERILGVVRIESKKVGAYTQQDLRLLRSICDLTAVVLERANLFKEIKELAITDPLTSLFLREYLFARLKEEISRAKSKKSGLGIIMIDIDNFKNINDTHGHRVGDIVLKRLAKILLQLIGDSGNMVSRFGGEEFVGFLVECDKKHLIEVAESIRETVENTIVSFRRKKIVFTVSAGAVMYPDDGEDILELIDNVDHLLYKAKREGKNRVCFIKRKKK